MRVILDECLPKKLGRELIGHAVSTVSEAGWAGLKNGALLRRIDGAFDAFITVDRNLPAQNNLQTTTFAVIVVRARSNKIGDLRPLVPRLLRALATSKPSDIVLVASP